MTIIRYLLSYSLLFLLVALLAAAWIYRDTLAPELNAAWTRLEARLEGRAPQEALVASEPASGKRAETAAPEMPAEMTTMPATEQAPVMAETPRSEPPMAMQETEPEPEPETETETAMAPAPAMPEPAPVEQPGVSEAETAAETPTPETTAAAETTTEVASASAETAAAMSAVPNETSAPVAEASPAPETGTSPTPQVATAGEGEAEPAASTAPAMTTESGVSSPAAEAPGPSEEAILLDRARRAYWAGDLPAAAAAYEALLDRDPAEADVWGELGNVYYAMGRWHDAGLAYYEAARRLIDRGDTRQLGYLLRIIDSLAPEKGSELRARLAPASG